MSSQSVIEIDPIGVDTYGYPKVDIMKGAIRISDGWFFVGLDEDEPACYLDLYILRDGHVTLILDRLCNEIELDLGTVRVPNTCKCYCECCKEVKEGEVCPVCLEKCMAANYPQEPSLIEEWRFPQELETFNPKDTRLEKIFKDPIALIAYAQYRRKHIVSKEMNDWLPIFAEEFSKRVAVVKKLRGKLTLKILVGLWVNLWRRAPQQNCRFEDYDEDAIIPMVQPILPYVNGEKRLKLVKKKWMTIPLDGTFDYKFFLVTEEC